MIMDIFRTMKLAEVYDPTDHIQHGGLWEGSVLLPKYRLKIREQQEILILPPIGDLNSFMGSSYRDGNSEIERNIDEKVRSQITGFKKYYLRADEGDQENWGG